MKKIAFILCLAFVFALLPARADTNENKQIVYTYITETLGYNRAAACGILANIQYESNFRPTAIGDSGNAYGICQWNSRRESLKKHAVAYCEANGLPADPEESWKNIYAQLSYLGYELLNNKKSVGTYLSAVPDTAQGAYDAAYYFCVYFEIPSSRYTKGVTRGTAAVKTYFPMFGGSYETYTLSFDGRGGSGVPAKMIKTEGVPLTIPDAEPALPGYAFTGWSLTPEGEIAYQPGDTLTDNTDILLYACWTQTAFSDLILSRDEGGYTVIGYTGTASQITIPDQIDGVAVVGIDYGAFCENANVKTVCIPSSVLYLDPNAFAPGTTLAALPGGPVHIFAKENGFTFLPLYPDGSIKLSGDLQIVESGAFSGLTVTHADFSASALLRIESGAFTDCPQLSLVSLPGTVTYIARDAFDHPVTITAPAGSYAQSYAESRNWPFIAQ